MRLFFSLIVVCFLGVGALYAQTNGFTVLTTEAARRDSIAMQPRPILNARLQHASGQIQGMVDALRADGRTTIVNFMYTRCISICMAMGSEFQQLQNTIQARGLADKVRLLSISFDPADTPAQLAHYARNMRARASLWQFAGMPDARERRAMLDLFGITVIADTLGQFEHNAAYHIVSADGRLLRIIDFSQPEAVLDFAAQVQP